MPDEIPWLAHTYCHTSLLGEICAVHTTQLGEDNWWPHAWSLLFPALCIIVYC